MSALTAQQQQQRVALDLANRVRLERQAALRDLENGDVSLADVMAEPCVQAAWVMAVVERLPFPGHPARGRARSGNARRCRHDAEQMLERVGVYGGKRVRELTGRQVAAVLAEWERTRAGRAA